MTTDTAMPRLGALERKLLLLCGRVQLDSEDEARREKLVLRGVGSQPVRRAAVDELLGWACQQAAFVADRKLRLLLILFGELVSWPRLHRLRLDDAFSRAERVLVDGAGTWTLSPVDLVLYL